MKKNRVPIISASRPALTQQMMIDDQALAGASSAVKVMQDDQS